MDNNTLKKKIIISLIISVIISVVVILFYFIELGKQGVSDESAVWGTFGDYVGGVVGTLFAFIATYLLYHSITLQIKEFSTLSQLQQIQNFDTRFFNLIGMHSNILSGIQEGDLIGNKFISSFVNELAKEYSENSEIQSVKSKLKLKKSIFNNLILYFFSIINFIEQSNIIIEKDYYFNHIRTSLNNNELIIIAYYLSEKEEWKFDENLIELFIKAGFFNNIDLEEDIKLEENEYSDVILELINKDLISQNI